MARLQFLPPELLLNIASFLQPNMPDKLRIHKHYSDKTYHESLRRDMNSVVSLSSVCRQFRQTLTPPSYTFIAIYGGNAAKKLMALLRLLQEKPQICDEIKHLCLDLHRDPLDLSGVTVRELQSLHSWDKNPSIRIDKWALKKLAYHQGSKFKPPAGYDYIDHGHEVDREHFSYTYSFDRTYWDPEEYDHLYLAFATCVLLYALPGLKKLAISCGREVLQCFHFPLDFQTDPNPWLRPNEALEKTSPLPALETLTLRIEHPSRGWRTRDLLANEHIALSFLGRCASELCIEGFARFGTYIDRPELPDNITALILKEAWLDIAQMAHFLHNRLKPTKFMYFEPRRMYKFDFQDAYPAGPFQIIDILRYNATQRSTLRTLCVDLSQASCKWGPDSCYDNFESFVALENLWVNAWCLQKETWYDLRNEGSSYSGDTSDTDETSDSDDSEEHSGTTDSDEVWKPNPVLANLPPSLKRLHLAGSAGEVKGLEKDLKCLALQNTNLKEIAFEMPSSGHYLYDLFENAGVKALRRVDDEPVMW